MLKIGTDCSGIGAPEQAIKNLGIEHRVVFACEKDKYARQTYLANHSCEKMYEDVTERDNAGMEQLDLYIAGFPCQAFSLAGKRKGFDDIRGTIFFNCADYIRQNRPKVFIFENVRGLLSHDKPKGSKQKTGRTFQTILNLLSKSINGQPHLPFYKDHLDYDVYWKILDTKNFGLPQNRERVFIVGIRDGESFSFPKNMPLTKRLVDMLQKGVDKKYYLSDLALDRIVRRSTGFKPAIDPEITNTLNARNNSGELCIDPGTTLISEKVNVVGKYGDGNQCGNIYDVNGIAPTIVAGSKGYVQGFIEIEDEPKVLINNEGNWEERKIANAITASYHKANGTMNRQHTFILEPDPKPDPFKILSYTLDKKGKVTQYNERDTANTIHTSTGSGGSTDQFVIENLEPINDEEVKIIQRDHGFNKGGEFDICPTITGQSWKDNNILSISPATTEPVPGNESPVANADDNNHRHGKRYRRLTPRETFRLQGYPDSFNISLVSETQAYRQSGNSISVPVIENVIKNLMHIF